MLLLLLLLLLLPVATLSTVWRFAPAALACAALACAALAWAPLAWAWRPRARSRCSRGTGSFDGSCFLISQDVAHAKHLIFGIALVLAELPPEPHLLFELLSFPLFPLVADVSPVACKIRRIAVPKALRSLRALCSAAGLALL